MIAAILALSVIVLVTVSDVSSTLLSNRTVFKPVAVLKRSFLPIVEIYHGNKHRSRLYGQWGLFQSNYTIQFDKSAERTPIVGIGNFFSTEFTINDTIVATFKRKWTIIGIEYDVALETGTNLEEWLAYFLAYFLVEHGAL
ncbi:hypothetical protein DdX_14893 [Ditylenchus destructor]|uniref:Uncharacterized protein n=1 Tax=Ditylenchus destructor TaxID=166010 RepID=A0AAD4MTN8_9BILA|nr:hypothetical protein DdX_14893 [Ditylenchus destructor]